MPTWFDVAENGQVKNIGPSPALFGPSLGIDNKMFRDLPVAHSKSRAPIVMVDGGNGGLKIAVMMAGDDLRFVARRVESCVAPLRNNRSSYKPLAYAVNGGREFRIGNPDDTDARPIRIGSTAQRIADKEYVAFLLSAIVDTLIVAGWSVGKKQNIYLGYAVPGDEIVNGAATDETKAALRTIKDVPLNVCWSGTDREGSTELRLVGITPISQTGGILYGLTRDIFGASASKIVQANTLDIGFGHTQLFRSEVNGDRTVTSGDILGYGMTSVADSLILIVKEKLGIDITSAQAQHAIISKAITAGIVHDVSAEVEQAIDIAGEELLQKADKAISDNRSWLVVAGGGSVALRSMIEERAAAAHRPQGSTKIIPAKVAPFAGVIGNFAYLIHSLNSRKPWMVTNGSN